MRPPSAGDALRPPPRMSGQQRRPPGSVGQQRGAVDRRGPPKNLATHPSGSISNWGRYHSRPSVKWPRESQKRASAPPSRRPRSASPRVRHQVRAARRLSCSRSNRGSQFVSRGPQSSGSAASASCRKKSAWRSCVGSSSTTVWSCSRAYRRKSPAAENALVQSLRRLAPGTCLPTVLAASSTGARADWLLRMQRVGCFDAETTGEHRESIEEPALLLRKEVVAPPDGRLQGLLARVPGGCRQRGGAGGRRVERPLVQPGSIETRACGELNSQRDAIQAMADLDYRGSVVLR